MGETIAFTGLAAWLVTFIIGGSVICIGLSIWLALVSHRKEKL